VGPKAALLLGPPLISRLLVHTGRFSGLSAVYQELFDFGGSEIYVQPEPGLVGRSFREALLAYDDSAIIGILGAGERLMLPPKFDYVIQPGDQAIVIAEDDDTAVLNGRAGPLREDAIVKTATLPRRRAERTLILGTNERLGLVLRELGPYGALGSQTLVVGENAAIGEAVVAAARTQHPHLNVAFRAGDVSDRALLDSLNVLGYEYVLVLSETGARSHDVADARTMVTLLHLRDIMQRGGKKVPVTTEILDIANRELAAEAEADDFVVSNTLIALLVAQLAENVHLTRVFEELLTYGGHDIRIRRASSYVVPGVEVDLYQVVESAARRDEVVIGYRVGAQAKDPARAFGVRVNPRKREPITFTDADEVLVLTRV
jgi:voltage-gated potassium channel Kch